MPHRMIPRSWQDGPRAGGTHDVGPWLLCLDLQREFVVEGRPLYSPGVEGRVEACRVVLDNVRAAGWPVIHAQRRREGGLFCDGGEFVHPVPGLEPLASEALFFRSQLSAFASPGLRALAPPTPGTTVFLAALSIDSACMATVLQGVDIGLRVKVVEDVIGALALGPYGSGVVAGVAKRLIAPCARFESADNMHRAARFKTRARQNFISGGN